MNKIEAESGVDQNDHQHHAKFPTHSLFLQIHDKTGKCGWRERDERH